MLRKVNKKVLGNFEGYCYTKTLLKKGPGIQFAAVLNTQKTHRGHALSTVPPSTTYQRFSYLCARHA